jgi:hypothetical protein
MKYISFFFTLMVALCASEQASTQDPLKELKKLEPKMGDIELFDYVERNQLYDILLPRHPMDRAVFCREPFSLRISIGVKRLAILEEKIREDHFASDMLDKLNRELMIDTEMLSEMLKHRLATSRLYRSKIRGEEIVEQKSSVKSTETEN